MDSKSEVEKMPFYKKKWVLVTLAVIVAAALLPKGNDRQNNTGSTKGSDSSVIKNEDAPKVPANLESRLTKEIESIKKGVDFSSYHGEVIQLQLVTVLFRSWSEMIKEGLASSNTNEVKLADELKKLVVKTQEKELPLIRKHYVEVVRKKLWENNIEVSGGGSKNTTINLVGGSFFNNKNKSDVQSTISSILTEFRFKKSIYKAYDSQAEYTYYTIDSPSDGELY